LTSMQRILFTTLTSFLIFGSGYTQSIIEAKAVMDRVSQKLQSYKSLKIEFTFTLENEDEPVNDSMEGTLLLAGNKYRLNVMGILALCDGEALWTVNDELKEVNVMNPDENELFNPSDIFSLYDKKFTYQPVSSTPERAIIDLIPAEKEDSYTKIRLEILKAKDQIEEVTYFSTDGNLYIITINSLTANVPADERKFTFESKDFPGLKVFDLR